MKLLHAIGYAYLLLIVLFRVPVVFAVAEFQADYDVQYAIAPSGVAIVTQNVVLTNKLSNLYPQKYTILIDSDRIKNVIATDEGGVITPEIAVQNGKTNITLTFNRQVVGVGKTMPFKLRYEHGDVAHKVGSIWEVTVPGVSPDPDLGTYDVTLQVPPVFGPNAYLVPYPAGGRNTWTRDQMLSGGIAAAYGTEQIFALTLSYYLENQKITGKTQEIALPPDTAFQKVTLTAIDPAPREITQDADGNWLARYDLLPTQKLSITAKITVALTLEARPEWEEKPIMRDAYLTEQKYWESADPRISTIAKTHTTPRSIYDFVVGTLSYDYDRVNQNPIRKGAVQTLLAPQNSICMEFTDLFVAIARAAGIPAREAVGFAYTTNTHLRPLSLVRDVLHAWPQYYDEKEQRWISVDPTWTKTTGGINYFDKLDFNHIVFAIHGLSSTYPYPAGSYRPAQKEGKDIVVEFGTPPPATNAKIDVRFLLPKTIYSGWPAKGSIEVVNTAQTGVTVGSIIVQVAPHGQTQTQERQYFPPLGSVNVPIAIEPASYFYRGAERVVVTVDGQTFEASIPVNPPYMLYIPIGIAVAVAVALMWIVVNAKNLWKHHKKH